MIDHAGTQATPRPGNGPPARLHYWQEACLPWRSPLSDCRRCADACPVDALQPQGDGWKIDEHCLGCGQCAVVCPTGALEAAGFQEARTERAIPAPVVDCHRVPFDPDAQAVRVPCTGGLGLADVLQLHRRAGGHGPIIRDRGWCTACPAGGDNHPARDVLERAREILSAFGVPAARLPRLDLVPTDDALARPAIPAPVTERRLRPPCVPGDAQ
ncbi:MAG: 4Fe-4S binding protein [Halofilum sp. (in: g-proteobacteria)]|nr:4Fe-4S binding protein [Halofilum sp. (in: g-proteobacteria)]